MRVALIGYGKMGKTIEKILIERGHKISAIVDVDGDLEDVNDHNTDVAIEFTSPESAFKNIKYCLEHGIRVVSGSTGWLEKKQEIDILCIEEDTAFFYASNYSIGVNVFFALNQHLARIMNTYKQYGVSMEEIHHTEKLDAPSGTAITLAEGVIEEMDNVSEWTCDKGESENNIDITAKRTANVPGTHIIKYNSDVDEIEIKHTAHNRDGFALGAVMAAEFVKGKQGNYGMKDLIKL